MKVESRKHAGRSTIGKLQQALANAPPTAHDQSVGSSRLPRSLELLPTILHLSVRQSPTSGLRLLPSAQGQTCFDRNTRKWDTFIAEVS